MSVLLRCWSLIFRPLPRSSSWIKSLTSVTGLYASEWFLGDNKDCLVCWSFPHHHFLVCGIWSLIQNVKAFGCLEWLYPSFSLKILPSGFPYRQLRAEWDFLQSLRWIALDISVAGLPRVFPAHPGIAPDCCRFGSCILKLQDPITPWLNFKSQKIFLSPLNLHMKLK